MLNADLGEILRTFSKYLVINRKNYKKLEDIEKKKSLFKFWRNIFLGCTAKIKNLQNTVLFIYYILPVSQLCGISVVTW